MSVIVEETDRSVIPRWRDSTVTVALGELAAATVAKPRLVAASDFLEEKRTSWQLSPSIVTAAEFVGAALVLGYEPDAREAAQFLVRAANATESVRRVATRLLTRVGEPSPSSLTADIESVESAVQRIRSLRHRLHEEPRNAVLWTDLSREYASIGENAKAEEAMTVATRLVSGNRFVLRSAARLWVHLGDPERAHDLLRRREATPHDPWLLAAEIAVAQVAGKRSKLLRRGAKVLKEPSLSPKSTAELASALATVEMLDGSRKHARRLFAHSLRAPTDNSLAQATWAERHLAGIAVQKEALELPRTFEARVWRSFAERNWRKSVDECELWLRDEPFSERPAQLGSYVAIVGVADYRLGERLARSGLRANPNDPMLQNNLVVALAEQGLLDEAERLFKSIRRPAADGTTESTLLATAGLLAFRRGRLVEGRTLYDIAIKKARENQLERTRILAEIHLVREEIIAKSPGAAAALTAAFMEYRGRDDPDVTELLERLRRHHNEQQLAGANTL